MPEIKTRDLEADLAICEAATPGPWEFQVRGFVADIFAKEDIGKIFSGENTIFVREAREGWPYAIHRALNAEAEVDRLRNELDILQEQLQQSGRCWE